MRESTSHRDRQSRPNLGNSIYRLKYLVLEENGSLETALPWWEVTSLINAIWWVKPTSPMDLYIAFVILEGLLAVAIISINLLVCATVYLHRELRCITNYLIVCLAVADLGVGTLAVPFSIVLSMEYSLCFHTCLFLTCFPLVTTQFSILLLLVIALNAHLKIKLPNRSVKVSLLSTFWL